MNQPTRPRPRTIIAPGVSGWFVVYIDDPDGLIITTAHRNLGEALKEYPGAIVLRRLWDAPIIDPADPETHPPDSDPAYPTELRVEDFPW